MDATVNDNYSLPEIHERLSKSELLPNKHLVDGGYIEASNLVESRREYDIDLIGPAQSNGRWQQVQGNGFGISNFQFAPRPAGSVELWSRSFVPLLVVDRQITTFAPV